MKKDKINRTGSGIRHDYLAKKRTDITAMDVDNFQALKDISDICISTMKHFERTGSVDKKVIADIKLMRILALRINEGL